MNLLMAQAAAPAAPLVIVPGVLFLILLVTMAIGLPTFLTMRNATRRRAWEHEERMKAMELGHVIPTDQSSWARASVCIAIGGLVPVGAFFFTWLASLRPDAEGEIWLAPTLVGLGAVISASVLASRLFTTLKSPKADQQLFSTNGKPAFDADAFDVVSSRG